MQALEINLDLAKAQTQSCSPQQLIAQNSRDARAPVIPDSSRELLHEGKFYVPVQTWIHIRSSTSKGLYTCFRIERLSTSFCLAWKEVREGSFFRFVSFALTRVFNPRLLSY